MNKLFKIREATKKLGRNQKLILKSLHQSPQSVKQFSSVKSTVLNLQGRELIEIKNNEVYLTELGQAVCEYWQQQNKNGSTSESGPDKQEREISSRSVQLTAAKLEKSNQFIKLYKQGLSYQQIGDRFGISRERVRQVLKPNPAFHEYLKQKEEEKEALEREQEEKAKQDLYSRSLAAMYPERVAELWDYERNGDLKPEEVLAGTTVQSVWLKCP
ncbi:MAG: sigma factor-like helix-turn-helix DNA-binding protein, partial [Cyanobacteria bacterium J06554_6]